MQFYKYFILMVVALQLTGAFCHAELAQDGTPYLEALNERDFEALYNYLETKREINLSEKDDQLHISGRINFEWRHMTETQGKDKLRGHRAVKRNSGKLPVSCNDFDIEFGLDVDYDNDTDWAIGSLKFDNPAGVDDCAIPCAKDDNGYHGSGRGSKFLLKKAFWGYTIYHEGDVNFEVEGGRRGNLYNAFDSKIQFLSRFDGILFRHDNVIPNFSDFYLKLAGFVVDERVNQFAWIVELAFMDIKKTGLEFKYSYIDWQHHGKNICFVNNPRAFQCKNSQFLLKYNCKPEWLCGKETQLYAAFLVNTAAHPWRMIRERAQYGWYYGFTIGRVKKEGDWAIDIDYEVVQAKAMPDDDVGGIGRGNILETSTTSVKRGNTNYRGWSIDALYALTDNWNVQLILQASKAYDKRIGGPHTYSKLEVEFIYAF